MPRDLDIERLRAAAEAAALRAYAPYSKFRVGAAVLTDKGIFSGANVESASYGLTLCAERCALATAKSAGAGTISMLAIHFADAGLAPADALRPCGACRQWLVELLTKDATVHVSNTGEVFTLDELLPNAFDLKAP